MDTTTTEENPKISLIIEKFLQIEEKYGDSYPIILYDPLIHSQERKTLKSLIQENSVVHLFSKFEEAFEFAQSLGISFTLIVSHDFEEKVVLTNFKDLANTFGRAMLSFEEEKLFKDLFPKISDDSLKSLDIKAYVFVTFMDFMNEVPDKEDEEEVIMMCDLKEMVSNFRKEYDVIWYDPHLSLERRELLNNKVDIEERNIYNDPDRLRLKIYNPESSSYFLIMAGGEEAQKIVNDISSVGKSLVCLFIYSDGFQIIKNSSRKIIVKETLGNLVTEVIRGIRNNSSFRLAFPAFATNFDAFDKSDEYNLHYYLKGLINFKNREQARTDFLKLAKKIYESKKLIQFEKEYLEYERNAILSWYTVESPIYKLVNNCLRLATPDSILYCRYILKDLESAIRDEYRERSHEYNGVVYRGTYISPDEWEKLQNNKGKEIEMYGFMSTSKCRNRVFADFLKDLEKRTLITAIIPSLPSPEIDEQGFADISKISKFEEEAEILFNMRSKFRILETEEKAKVKYDGKDVECRHLVLLYGPQLLKRSLSQSESLISVKLNLPSEIKCATCGSDQKLYGFNQEGTQIRCISCLRSGQIPKDIPLLAINSEEISEEKKELVRKFQGKIVPYNDKVKFPYYGYKCKNCKETSKETYYKWIDLKTEQIYEQCSDCFTCGREVEADVLLAESNPYVFWRETETEGEKIESDYKQELSQEIKEKGPCDVFLETQQFDLCIAYGQMELKSLTRKRRREMRKFKILVTLGEASEKCGKHHDALGYFTKALEIIKTFSRFEHPETAALYNNLALVHQSLGEPFIALEYSRKALGINQVLHGHEHIHTAVSYQNLAGMYDSCGQYQMALECFEKSLKITKKFYKDKHPFFATLYNNLGSVLMKIGQYEKALEYFMNAFGIVKAIYGEKHPHTASSYNNIAEAYKNLGQHKEALVYLKKALELVKGLYGDRHPQLAEQYNNLAVMLHSLGMNKEAFEELKRGLDIANKLLEDEHPNIASFYNSFAGVFESLGQHKEARKYSKKALDIRRRKYGEEHPETAVSYCNFALVLNSLGENKKALKYSKKSLRIRKTLYSDKHPDVAHSYSSIGFIQRSSGDYNGALKSYEHAREIIISMYGENFPQMATLYNNFAELYQSQNNYQKALPYSKKVLEIRKGLYGEQHPETATAYNNIAEVYKGMKEYKDAIENFTKALDLFKSIYGDQYYKTAAVSYNLAEIYEWKEEYLQALEYYQKALDIVKIILGENHEETANTYYGIASALHKLERYEEAIFFHKKAFEITKTLLGNMHPKTIDLYIKLEILEFNYANFKESQKSKKKTLNIQIHKKCRQ